MRYGFPLMQKADSTMVDSDLGYISHYIYKEIPFLVELQVLLDWTFTKTSMEVFGWRQLYEYRSALFLAYRGNYSIYAKKVGDPI